MDREAGPDLLKELEAMKAIADALSKLEEASVRRVIHWATDAHKAKSTALLHQTDRAADTPAGGASSELRSRYPTLAEFFSGASPMQEADKALVVGYWFQVVEGITDLDGFSINKELKHLGHGVRNVTSALDTLMSRRPALVIQTKKSGTSKQARKKYKLTLEGQKAVERMLNHDH